MSQTLREILSGGAARLKASGIREAWREAEELGCQALGLGRPGLWAAMDEAPSPEESRTLEDFLRRREAREPLQLILGTWEFMGLRLAMGRGVFIPRPETEALAHFGLEKLRGLETLPRASPRILDLGLGSGALLASLLALGPRDLRGLGVDRSWEACSLARRNLAGLDLAGRFFVIQGDWAEALAPGARFKLLVANPPYLDQATASSLEPEIAWDPREALYAGEGGLADIRRILSLAETRVEGGGWLALESGPLLAQETMGLLGGAWQDPEFIRESSGIPVGIGCRKRT